MNKVQQRNEIRKLLMNMSLKDYEEKSRSICEVLLQEPSIIEGKTIALTISVFPEVETREIITKLWAMDKHVVVPKCNVKTKQMQFYHLTNFNELVPASMGLFEPNHLITSSIEHNQIDVCIVPGIVFDQRGYRIGYGGGYYDRFLPQFNGEKISIAFDEQFVNEVSFELHDIPIDFLITNKRRISFRERG